MATQGSHTTPTTGRLTLTTSIPLEVRKMIYGWVFGDHTIHIKSDVILKKSDSKDDEGDDEKDEDAEEDAEDEEEDEGEEDEEEKLPAELLEIGNDDRGPLYHRLCNEELLHPKDARLYRIRSLQAEGSRASRVQTDIAVRDFKHIRCPELSDPKLEYETIGEEEDEPAVQVKLGFLRANKQVYHEASEVLYTTQTFGFDDPTTFAQFFSIICSPIAEPPTPTNGTVPHIAKRKTIRSVHMRAKTALWYRQKILWIGVLNAAPFVMPELKHVRVLFDLCHEGNDRHVDRTRWPYSRHRYAISLLKTAEVRVASHLAIAPKEGSTEGDEPSDEFREPRWRRQLLEAIAGHHMDVLFGAGILDPAGVAAREATFAHE